MKELTLTAAQELLATRLAALAPGCPPRLHPCIVHGPTDGYCVVTVGFARANDLTEAGTRQPAPAE